MDNLGPCPMCGGKVTLDDEYDFGCTSCLYPFTAIANHDFLSRAAEQFRLIEWAKTIPLRIRQSESGTVNVYSIGPDMQPQHLIFEADSMLDALREARQKLEDGYA